MAHRLAVDIGGTFVDSVKFDRDTKQVRIQKAETTPADPTEGVLNAIEKVEVPLEDTEAFVHGTTLGINAFIEREGADVGIITNEGFRDIFEIARLNVLDEEKYNIHYKKPEMLVPRRSRLGIPGRLDHNGEIVEPLDKEAVIEAGQTIFEEFDNDAVVVCFLHAYKNPVHEERARELLNDHFPDKIVTISSEVTREYREYERMTTSVMDAYIKPIFTDYVNDLDESLADNGFDSSFFINRSGGGALSAEKAKSAPVQTILSGPAGGLIGSGHIADILGKDNLISVDMGGTSLDTCVIEQGEPAVSFQSKLDHYPLLIPAYDIRTIGAGGGSIAWEDSGLLKVGPKSAGSDPGPICYGKGGEEPTLTDAAVVLGYIDPEEFLGGEIELQREETIAGFEEKLCDPLGISVTEAAKGVFDVTLANTIGAVREITVEKGLDPRDFSMLAFGGAGPLFSPLMGRQMNVEEVIVPQAPSVFSAWGMMMSDVVYDYTQTDVTLLEDTDMEAIYEHFEELEEEAVAELRSDGFDDEHIELQHVIEARYLGQEHTIDIDVSRDDTINSLSEKFDKQHESRFGHQMDDPPEIVHFRIRAVGRNEKPALEQYDNDDDDAAEPVNQQEGYCFAEDALVDFEVYQRNDLSPDEVIDGPAIVREPTTTIVFHSDQQVAVDKYGHLIISEV